MNEPEGRPPSPRLSWRHPEGWRGTGHSARTSTKPDRQAPEPVIRAGPYIIASMSLGVGVLWTLFVPPTSFLAPDYLIASGAWFALVWWWSGNEPIPGVRKAYSGLQGNKLVLLAAILTTGIIAALTDRFTNLVSGIAWSFLCGGVQWTVLGVFYMRRRDCPGCHKREWALRYRGAWYCGKCGLKRAGTEEDPHRRVRPPDTPNRLT